MITSKSATIFRKSFEFNLLTGIGIILLILATKAPAQIINQKDYKTHHRWELIAGKEKLFIEKKRETIFIKTLDENLLKGLRDGLGPLSLSPKYFKIDSLRFSRDEDKGFWAAAIDLKNPDVELFSFYRDSDKKYVMDFWIDGASPVTSRDKKEMPGRKVVLEKVKKKGKVRARGPAASPTSPPKAKIPLKREERVRDEIFFGDDKYRDFRYGASFIWDYDPLSPKLKKIVNIARKTPEYFYPIKDRDSIKSEEDAHLQLTINLYRKKKWGLMYKSIRLYQKKYGEEKNSELYEYLKANALLRTHFQNPKGKKLIKVVMNMLANIVEKTKNYELKKGISKYLLSFLIDNKEHIQALQRAKKLYVMTKEAFDIEESRYAMEAVFYNLAQLNQDGAIREVLKDKTVIKLMPAQLRLAYELFVLLKKGNIKRVIDLYEQNSKSMAMPVGHTIMYNTAEAYFRAGEYEKSLKLYDSFIDHYSHNTHASYARVRMALIYEILEKDHDQTLELYSNAINRSQNFDASYEARIRYVGMRSVRKRKIDKKDREIRVFLDSKKQKDPSSNLKKLLWLVRLRTFIVEGQWSRALSYLNAIPLNSLKQVERRVFEGDGAEVIYGIIVKRYENSEYSRLIQIWDFYKNKYVNKVATDPFINYIVAYSYTKLGLYEKFDQIVSSLEKMDDVHRRTYPVWPAKGPLVNTREMFLELKLVKDIKLKNWELVKKTLEKMDGTGPLFARKDYYRGIVAYNEKKHKKSIEHFEKYLAEQQDHGIYDISEMAKMFEYYTDSIYQTGNLRKFKKVVNAILQDVDKGKNSSNKEIKKLGERLRYLEIETMAGEATPDAYLAMEGKIAKFLKRHPKSIHGGRIRYLLGLAFMANKREQDGKKLFDEILKDDKVSEYIKGLVRSELSLMRIKERVL